MFLGVLLRVLVVWPNRGLRSAQLFVKEPAGALAYSLNHARHGAQEDG